MCHCRRLSRLLLHMLCMLCAGIHPWYAAIYIFSMLFPALDTIFKERVFR